MQHIRVKLEPVTATKPRIAIDQAADLARRIGAHVMLTLNGVEVTVSPTATKASIEQAWSAAAAKAEAEHP
jgi:hypothetical protein